MQARYFRGYIRTGIIAALLLLSGCSILSRQRWDEHRSRESWMDVYENLPTTKASD